MHHFKISLADPLGELNRYGNSLPAARGEGPGRGKEEKREKEKEWKGINRPTIQLGV